MKIQKITYNWHTDNYGEQSCFAEVGTNGVTHISEHRPEFAGDTWYYDVDYGNNKTLRIFNINQVEYVK